MPLRQTEDAVLIDTSDMTIQEALSLLLCTVSEKQDR
jgi:cytidylate kinase